MAVKTSVTEPAVLLVFGKGSTPMAANLMQWTPHHAVSIGTYKYWYPAILACPRGDAASSFIKLGAMGVLPWRYTDEKAGPVTWCLKCIRPSRCCSFTPVVRTTALQVTLVLSGPRTIARHQQLELFVLIGRVGMPGECFEDQKGSKSPRSLMTVDSTSRRFYRHLQILVPC